MKINIEPMTQCVNRLCNDINVTKPQIAALNRIAKIVHHAQNAAYARPPQPCFTYTETIFSVLLEELSSKQVETLNSFGITFYKNTGTSYHQVRMAFHS